ncbi:uncharacterized protein LOC130726089 [Lotus japonicus]|uniref:uncharacterized protein LOC130726089 n=1 Tax=Lotus japonicus TaxID=34305 RepID=UPI00258B0257|nr:uncharacterized protein LOC130726089 [Lotus japonicus]
MFEQSNSYHKTQIKGKGTALHVAVNNGNADVVRRLVEAVVQHEGAASGGEEGTSALATRNEQGASPLHLAARRGFDEICKCIIGAGGERRSLMCVRNEKGETPLFSAVKTRQLKTFALLYQLFPNDTNLAIRNKDDSILHIAIRREFLDMAVIIVHCYPVLLDLRNGDQATPLEIIAARPSAFKSGTYLTWGKRILYHCIYVKPLDAKTAMKRYLTSEGVGKNRNKASSSIIEKDKSQVAIQLGPVDTSQAISEKEDCARYADINVLCFQFADIIQKLVFIFCLPWLSLLGISIADLVAIYKLKQKHTWASQLLNKFMENPYQSYMGIDGNNPLHYTEDHDEEKDDEEGKLWDVINQIREQRDSLNKVPGSSKQKAQQSGKKENYSEAPQENEKIEKYVDSQNKESGSSKQKAPQQNEKKEKYDPKETAFLAAAKNGIVEIVLELRNNIESVVHDTNSNKQNVLLVAVKNRQPYVVVELRRNLKSNGHIRQFDSLTFETDNEDNNVLHMAAGSVSNKEKTWQIAGAAMQMMWDIKWYQYIKSLAPEHLACRTNKDGKTPGVVFQEQHRELVSEGSGWLKDTAESCSVVAALIAGVSFATASTVPGGNNQDSSHPDLNGRPALEGKPAFDTFAIASLVGLCFSVTALVMFLAILTSRKQVEDFRRSIPVKLLVGFSSLFVSIAAMLVAFCAGNFFLLKDKYKESIIFPIYVATCLPVTLYAIVQFPLYADLVKTILKKVPQPSGRGVNF